MVTVSDAAASKSIEILETEGKTGWGLRFFTAGSSCCGPSYGIDLAENPTDGDETIEKNGAKFFFDKDTFEKLSGMEINFIDDGEKQGFVVTGGDAPSCGDGGGCGSSCG
ncbi:MAG: iron-sulfur cluster assembly accessory protein [Nitrospira sp.]|nr:iron-sulfur cluster assembly accessory protein [bacterium]MBL7048544.1 iron-sulfur cluster assembly accessory protein [Nitrospira sp.]